MDPVTASDGRTLYRSDSDAERGSDAPFYVVYKSAAGADRYGWWCGNCDGLDVAMDPMGRIQCNRCGNLRKPTEWDAAHE